MVLNIEVADDVAEALAGGKVTLSAPPELNKLPTGIAALDDVEAVLSAAGITIAFELEPEEIRSIQRGSTQFLIHFHIDPAQGLPPFRFIFERTEFTLDNGTDPKEKDSSEPGLPESEGDPKAD